MQENKNKILKLTKSATSTLQKIQGLIEKEKNCKDIIQQINSVQGLLETTKAEVLTCYLHKCLEENLNKDKNQTIEDIVKILKLKK